MRIRIPLNLRHSLLLSCLAFQVNAQEMQPRAYVPTPAGFNFFGFSYTNNRGGLLFDPSLPVEDAEVKAHATTFAFGQTLGVARRTAQVLAVIPYVLANLDEGPVGARRSFSRSGLGDSVFRYSMNIHGAPAMDLKGFREYRQKTVVGASITVSAPTGQYDPNRLINVGTNRWAFKPELGLSRAVGKWTIEGAAGVWLYAANNSLLGDGVRTQDPLGSLQLHVVRVLPHRIWLAADGTLFTGGRTRVNGVDSANYQGNTRLGATFGMAVSPRQAIKVSYFKGVTTRFGTDITSIGVSYNLIWMKGR